MNGPQLRDLRLRASIGYHISPMDFVPIIEDVEDAMGAAEAADTESLKETIDQLKVELASVAKDRDEWREEVDNRQAVADEYKAERDALRQAVDMHTVSNLEADLSLARSRIALLEGELVDTKKSLATVQLQRDELANETTTLTVHRLAGFLVEQAEANRVAAAKMEAVVDAYRTSTLSGARVTYRDGCAYIALPRPFWRESGMTCRCGKCHEGDGMWDTLAIELKPRKGSSLTAWTCHHPELRVICEPGSVR